MAKNKRGWNGFVVSKSNYSKQLITETGLVVDPVRKSQEVPKMEKAFSEPLKKVNQSLKLSGIKTK